MKSLLSRYLPWIIVVILLTVSGVIFIEREAIANERVEGAATPDQTISPLLIPVTSPTVTPIPLSPKPSINGVRSGEDD